MKFLFCLVLLFLFSVAQTAAQDAQTASAAWQVVRYDIAAALPSNSTDRSLSAKAIVTVKNVGRAAGSSVTFRINNKAEVVGAKVGANNANFRKSEERLGNLVRFAVALPAGVPPGETAVITLEYRLPVAENSGLAAISNVGSQFLPLSAWYPTPNNPYSPRGADYAPFRLTVNGANGANVVSSGKANGAVYEQNLVAQPFFVVGDWTTLEDARGIAVSVPKGANSEDGVRAKELAELAANAKVFIGNALGNTAAININLVAVRRGAGFSDGGTILLDYAAFRRGKVDATTAMTVAEGVAKTYLGNIIQVRGEGYGAIREGLARYLAVQFIEKQFGKEAADIERLRQRTTYAAVAKRDAPLAVTSPLDDNYFATAANKGAQFWRLIAETIGVEQFNKILAAQLRARAAEGLTLASLREALAGQNEAVKQLSTIGLDQTTDTDLLIGLPQAKGGETVVALRNLGSLSAKVNVVATTDKGERLTVEAVVPDKNFAQASFKTTAKIVRVEVDPDKMYPQFDYANDVAPRETTENDLLFEVTRAFNKQEYSKAEVSARRILTALPRYDEVRTWLGRSLFEQGKLDEAEREFNAALGEKLPAPRTLAWANIGLGDIAAKRNQNAEAAKFYDSAVKADAEYGSNLTARAGRIKAESAANVIQPIDESAKTFLAGFDRAVLTTRKTEVDNLIVGGELNRFSSGVVGGQPEQWQTRAVRAEMVDANTMAIDVNLNAKLLGKDDVQTGTAVFVLTRAGGSGWKLANVDLFEVR